MKLSTTRSLESLQPFLSFIRKYSVFLFILVFLGIYVFLVQRIGSLIQSEPAQAAIDSKLQPVGRLKVDEQAVKQITKLEEQNIEVKSLFDNARQNPFTE